MEYQNSFKHLKKVKTAADNKTLALMNDMKFKRQTQLDNNNNNLQSSDVNNIKSSGIHQESYVKFMDLEDSEVKKSQGIFDRKSHPENDQEPSWKRSSKTLPRPSYDPMKEIEQIVEEISEGDSHVTSRDNRDSIPGRRLMPKRSLRPNDAVHL